MGVLNLQCPRRNLTTYTYFLNISKKEEKKHRMSSAGKKSSIHSHSFCLKKKNVFFPPTIIHHQFFSLFKKWKKRKTKHIIQEDARPFQKKQKQKLIEQKHPKIYISMQTKSS